jgi:hypothetical protein
MGLNDDPSSQIAPEIQEKKLKEAIQLFTTAHILMLY